MQDSGALPTPSSEPITADPANGPSAGLVSASQINNANLATVTPSMDEPTDTNIPDTPNPAGESDLVQDPTTVGEPVIINPSAGTGNVDDESIGR